MIQKYNIGFEQQGNLNLMKKSSPMCQLWPWPWRSWPLIKVMTHPWVMDNNCLTNYSSRSDKWLSSYSPTECEQTGKTDGQTDGWTDRQTGWFLYTSPPKLCCAGGGIPPPNFICGGYNKGPTFSVLVYRGHSPQHFHHLPRHCVLRPQGKAQWTHSCILYQLTHQTTHEWPHCYIWVVPTRFQRGAEYVKSLCQKDWQTDWTRQRTDRPHAFTIAQSDLWLGWANQCLAEHYLAPCSKSKGWKRERWTDGGTEGHRTKWT